MDFSDFDAGDSHLIVTPEVQAQRDQKAMGLLEKERTLDMPDSNRVALEKDIANRGGTPKPVAAGVTFDSFGEAPKPDWVEQGKRVAGNINEMTDLVLSTPAMVLGTATELNRRLGGLLAGESRDVYTKKAQERGQQVTALFDRPVAKLMNVLGYGEDYNSSDVKDAMGKVAGWIDTKGAGIEKATNGAIKKEDFQLMINELLVAGGVRGSQIAVGSMAKAAGKLDKIPPKQDLPVDSPLIGPDEMAKAGPQASAARAVAETANIKTAAQAAAWRAKRTADAKAAFTKESPPQEVTGWRPLAKDETPPSAEQIKTDEATGQKLVWDETPMKGGQEVGSGKDYADYLRFVADERSQAREQPKPSYTPPTPEENIYSTSEYTPATEGKTTWGDALRILKKPGFDRSASERIVLRDYLKESGMPTGVANSASAIVEGKIPEGAEAPIGPASQQGMVDPRLLARLAAIGAGGLIGAQIDPKHPLIAALIGGLGIGALTASAASIASVLAKNFPIKSTLVGATIGAFEGDDKHKLRSTLIGAGLGLAGGLAINSRGVDTRMRIDPVLNAYDHADARTSRAIMQLQTKVEKLVPNVEDRAKIAYALDSGDLSQLTPAGKTAAKLLQNNFRDIGAQAKGAGVIENTLDNYITHLWGKDGQAAIDQIVNRRGGPSMSPETRFALKRKYSTLAEGKAAGLTPLTEDASAIAAHYTRAVSRAMANKQLLKDLKGYRDAQGRPIILPSEKAPQGWISVQNPQIMGMRVHPDIAPSLRFMFEAQEPSVLMKGISGLNTAIKRNAVSLSLFHAKALGEAMLAASRNPVTALKTIYTSARGTNPYLKQLAEGGAGDLVDSALRDGLKFSMRKGAVVDEDVAGGFYNTMEGMQKFADKMIPGGGKVVGAYTKLNHAVDTFMWERLHTGLKLSVYADRVEALTQSNAKAHAVNPQVPLKSPSEIGEIAASFTNDTFGGLNWRRVAESAKTRWGREIAQGSLAPAGRRGLQLLMFAPDWTISTVRAATQAFGKGSGIKGLVRPQELADLHRQYMLRSALYYAVIGDTLNHAMSGHHLWENKNPFRIEMGDGRWLQLAKHATEPYEWLHQPGQQALNKLGTLPKEVATQLLGKEYLSTGTMPDMKSRVGHLLTAVSPIGVQQAFEQGPQAGVASGIAGALGVPIYGKTKTQLRKEAQEKRLTPKIPDAKKRLLQRMQRMQKEGLL